MFKATRGRKPVFSIHMELIITELKLAIVRAQVFCQRLALPRSKLLPLSHPDNAAARASATNVTTGNHDQYICA